MIIPPHEAAAFAALAHRREAAVRRLSPLAHQRAFADVLDGWADAAERRAIPGQGDLFASREGVTLREKEDA